MGKALIMPRSWSVRRDTRQDLTAVNSHLSHARDDVVGGVESGSSGCTVLMLLCGAVSMPEGARVSTTLFCFVRSPFND